MKYFDVKRRRLNCFIAERYVSVVVFINLLNKKITNKRLDTREKSIYICDIKTISYRYKNSIANL